MAASQRSYLDHNATAPLRPEVAEAMVRTMASPGNPSSVHAEGRAARAAVERAREQVASLVGVAAPSVLFTSGGTEACATVLSPSLRRLGAGDGVARLLVGATEHACVLQGHRFPPEAVETLPVDGQGVVDLAWLEERLTSTTEPVLASIQTANNETGVLQPVGEAARLVRARGGLVHTDAVQAAGRTPLSLPALGADVLTLSGHKLGGPMGVGAVVFASDRIEIGDRLLRGGGQERGLRAGTENVAAIVGFGVAAELAGRSLVQEAERLRALRDALEARLLSLAPDAVVFGRSAARLPNTLAFAIPGLRAETALIALDLEGVAVSSGSACSSGKVRRSHVLDAMGVPASLADGAIRVSLGWSTTESDVHRFAAACETVVATLYKRKANAA
jgi:cysteine desulfurase